VKDKSEYARFAEQCQILGCSPIETSHISRMIRRFANQYSWIPLDDFFDESMRALRRGLQTFQSNRSASSSTYLLTCVRNAVITLTVQEVRRRQRSRTVNAGEDWPIFDNAPGDQELMRLVSRVLSPLALQLLTLTVREHPKRRSPMWLGERLGVSKHAVEVLRIEMRRLVPVVLQAVEGETV